MHTTFFPLLVDALDQSEFNALCRAVQERQERDAIIRYAGMAEVRETALSYLREEKIMYGAYGSHITPRIAAVKAVKDMGSQPAFRLLSSLKVAKLTVDEIMENEEEQERLRQERDWGTG